jgi:hypothetical protein
MAPTPLTVGIPYREEGQDFFLAARGLSEALGEVASDVPIEVLICVNGSGPETMGRVARAADGAGLNDFGVKVMTSSEGKLAALSAIASERQLDGYLAFVDSDVVLAPNVLRLLWRILETDPLCMISYGQPVPVFPEKPNRIHHLSRVHYALRERAYHRPYFHGRTFMMRKWFLDAPTPSSIVDSSIGKRLRLDRGPLVDDIALSRMAVARWGAGAIREVPEANVYFDPPDDLRGLYAAALRVALEIARLDLLYPDHALLRTELSASSWRTEGLHRFSWRIRVLHGAHRILDAGIKALARLHVRLVGSGWLKVDTLWIRVPGTKSFARWRRAWLGFNVPPARPPRMP